MMNFVIETEQGEQAAEMQTLPATVKKMIGTLDALEDGRMLSIGRLAERVGMTKMSLYNHTTNPAMKPYRIELPDHRKYYANKTTVEEWGKDAGRDDA